MLERIKAASHRLSCALWGHVVDNQSVARVKSGQRRCRCGAVYLQTDGRTTHIRHTLSCFLRHHTYVVSTERNGAREYVCVRCGHPLVFPVDTDPFAGRAAFPKRVRYACGLFGHPVRTIAARNGFIEYACHCGHSFLGRENVGRTIRHPLVCMLTAHRIRFVVTRGDYAEYVCVDCGHPFCFAGATD